MTKPKALPPESTRMLEQLKALAAHAHADTDARHQAVQSAYEIGVLDGRLAGVRETSERMIAAVDKRIAEMLPGKAAP